MKKMQLKRFQMATIDEAFDPQSHLLRPADTSHRRFIPANASAYGGHHQARGNGGGDGGGAGAVPTPIPIGGGGGGMRKSVITVSEGDEEVDLKNFNWDSMEVGVKPGSKTRPHTDRPGGGR